MSSNATTTDPAQTPTPEAVSLSPDRAFVVHFYPAETGTTIRAGRAEHIQSGQTTHFDSWEELARFVAQTVGTSPRRSAI